MMVSRKARRYLFSSGPGRHFGTAQLVISTADVWQCRLEKRTEAAESYIRNAGSDVMQMPGVVTLVENGSSNSAALSTSYTSDSGSG